MPKPSVTYRELRNTPGRVFERLAAGEPLSLVAEGQVQALMIPVDDGDVATALEAWNRGRALVALGRLQATARAVGSDRFSMADVTAEVSTARKERRKRES